MFRKIARLLAITNLTAYFLLMEFAQMEAYIPIGVGIMLVALLQIPCIFTKYIDAASRQGIP